MLAKHPYGCRVIQRILEYGSAAQVDVVLTEIVASVTSLVQDQYANYVVQHVLENGRTRDRAAIIQRLTPNVVSMSQHKFASNVMEKCLEMGGAEERVALISQVIAKHDAFLAENGLTATLGAAESEDVVDGGPQSPLEQMMKDQYANYVVQKMLDISQGPQRDAMLARIRQYTPMLRKFMHGKHIIARIEKAAK
jgi:pumilio RNA-binding family